MQVSSAFHYIHNISVSVKDTLAKKLLSFKKLLLSDATQKVLIFVAIIALLLVAANLDNIM